jgi:hypothetical protein
MDRIVSRSASSNDQVHVRNAEDKREPEPSLQISDGLPEMIPPPLTRHDASLIHPQPFNGDEFVVLIEKFGLSWRVGHI